MNSEPAARPLAAESRAGLDGLASLRGEWEELARRSPGHMVSTSYPIYEALLRFRHPEPAHVHFFCIRETSGRLAAICPLELTRIRIRRLRFACWASPTDPDRPCSSFLLDGVSDPLDIGAALSVSLRRIAPRARLVFVERVLWDSETMSALRGIALNWHADPGPGMTVLTTRRSGDELLEQVSSKFRRNIRWGMRRVERLGRLDYRVASQPGEIAAGMSEFLRLEAEGWKGRTPHGRALARRDGVERHARALADGFGAESACELHGLWLDGRCIAALLCFRAGRELFAFKIARDERFKTYSLGHLLLFRVLSSLAKRPEIRFVNFGWEAGWMAPWGVDQVPLSDVHVGLGGFSSRLSFWLLGLPDRTQLRGMTRPG